jgi:integrase
LSLNTHPSRVLRAWTGEQVRAFLDSIPGDRLHAPIAVAVNTGLRRGELLGLKWSDVDLDGARLSVRRSLISVGYRLQWSEPKTAKSRRVVDLDAQTVVILREHRRSQIEERLAWGPGYSDGDLVFAKENGEPYHPDRFGGRFENLVSASGLPRIRFHDLRHTHATLGLAAGIHPKVMSERLGHSSISITLDTYSHAVPALQKDAADRIAALVYGG